MNKDIYNLNTFHRRAVLAICLLTVIIYSNTFNCAFVFDDQQNITQNPYRRLTELSLEKICDAAFKNPHANRPVANISFAVNYYLGKYNTAGYHVVNILIHLLNGILVYIFTLLTLKQAGIAAPEHSRSPQLSTAYISLFAALIFTAHPIQVQSVTYIVQRMNSLAVMFYLLSLILYIGGRSTLIRWKRWTQWSGCLLCWILALGSKEIAATLPLVLLLYEWYFFQNLSKDRLKQNLIYLIGLVVLLGLTAYMFLGSNPLDGILGSYVHRDFTLEERVLTQCRVLVFYLSLLFYPHPLRLNLLHHITTSHSLLDPVTTLFSLLILVFLLGLAVCIAKKQRLVSFCILWFFIHLVIESSIIGLEIIFEHRLYLPMVGLALMTAYLLFHLLSAHRTWVFIVSTAIIVSLGMATYLRNKVWQDPITLWYDVISKNPQSSRAQYNLGSDLAQQGNLTEAIDHLSEALRLKPDYTKAHNNLGSAFFKQGNLDQAANHFFAALRIQPGNSAAYYNLGLIMEKKGHPKAAAKHYLEALRIKPDFAEAHNNLGIALQAQGRLAEAVYHLSAALRIRPDYAEGHHNMGYALEMQGDVKKAIDHYLAALKIRTDDARTYNNLGVALTRLGMLKEAVRCYVEALRIKPDAAGALNNLGVLLHRQGKSKMAIDRYVAALKLKPDYAEAHNNLGIALARQGRFAEAADHFSEALRLQPDDAQARHNLSLIPSQKHQTKK
jgi:Flp pilus assembly protein TadD